MRGTWKLCDRDLFEELASERMEREMFSCLKRRKRGRKKGRKRGREKKREGVDSSPYDSGRRTCPGTRGASGKVLDLARRGKGPWKGERERERRKGRKRAEEGTRTS